MKLRLHEDSIRFRLGRREVARLLDAGAVESAVRLPDGSGLRFALRVADGVHAPEATFSQGLLLVTLPGSEVRNWATTDRVDISSRQSLGENSELLLLIEKDFQCLHKDGRHEDAFPNPARTSQPRHTLS